MNLKKSDYNYPRLQAVKRYFLDLTKNLDIPWNQVKIAASQHILEPQIKMFESFVEFGIQPLNIFVLGKIYSTNFEVLKEMNSLGLNAVQPDFNQNISFDQQHSENCREIFLKFHDDGEQTVALDDGGYLLEIFNQQNTKIIGGVEQTSSGFRRLENLMLNFPVYNVARSKVKLEDETPVIIALGHRRIHEKIKEWRLSNPRVLIVGLGPIGDELAKVMKHNNERVFEYDLRDGKKDILELITHYEIDIVVGATGSQIISHNEIERLSEILRKNIYFISMSSSDREFEVWKLRDLFGNSKGIHADIIYKNLTIANNGFPITFKGNRYESTPKEIEKTICLLFSGVMLTIIKRDNPNELIDIPEIVSEIIRK